MKYLIFALLPLLGACSVAGLEFSFSGTGDSSFVDVELDRYTHSAFTKLGVDKGIASFKGSQNWVNDLHHFPLHITNNYTISINSSTFGFSMTGAIDGEIRQINSVSGAVSSLGGTNTHIPLTSLEGLYDHASDSIIYLDGVKTLSEADRMRYTFYSTVKDNVITIYDSSRAPQFKMTNS